MPSTEGRPFPAVVIMTNPLPVIDFEGEIEYHRTLIRGDLKILSFKAQREMPRVGTPRYPTPWDRLHAEIDRKLTELQAIG
jgi:hypothetical protein